MRVLFIDIDTLRPDHMGCYGYHRDTTPNMDKVCAEGIRFDQYYCSDAPLPSLPGLPGQRHVRHPQRRGRPWGHRRGPPPDRSAA